MGEFGFMLIFIKMIGMLFEIIFSVIGIAFKLIIFAAQALFKAISYLFSSLNRPDNDHDSTRSITEGEIVSKGENT